MKAVDQEVQPHTAEKTERPSRHGMENHTFKAKVNRDGNGKPGRMSFGRHHPLPSGGRKNAAGRHATKSDQWQQGIRRILSHRSADFCRHSSPFSIESWRNLTPLIAPGEAH
jgi:hypothetical protein